MSPIAWLLALLSSPYGKGLNCLSILVVPRGNYPVLAQQLDHIDFLEEKVEALSLRIEQQLETMNWPDEPPQVDAGEDTEEGTPVADESEVPLTWNAAVALLDTIPGVNRRVAEVMLAEVGLDMSQFPTADHLASWAGTGQPPERR